MSFGGPGSRRSFWAGRRLSLELLERRDLLAVMRIVNWNTLNGPNDATADANFQTVLEAIGNETVQGNTKSIDILALQETDPPGAGGDSIGRIVSVLDALYPSTSFSSAVTSVDGGGDSTGFVYDTSTVSLLESMNVLSGSLTHNVIRGKFQPIGTSGESDFYVYSIHLKSGTTAGDATTRGVEAAALRSDADSLGEGAHVLFVGDFNMQGTSETAFMNLVASGAGQLQDVAGAPLGTWNDNVSYINLHSQDPQSTMDDRFDIQFATGEFFDDLGLEYVTNSYHVFGNNGTHTLNQPITTGTGASATVLNALVAASDHLPVVADYELLVSTPNVRITQTSGNTKVIEGGLYDTYYVVLDTVPAANVTVTVSPDSQLDVGNGAGVARVLTFTPGNALTPQVVIVNAANDAAGEGDHTGLITHTAASADANYNGISVGSVNVSIVDNDAPKIVINEIDADQTGIDAMEFVELYDGGVGNASLDGLTLVFYNGGDANDGSYLAIDLDGMVTDASGFFVAGNSGVPGVDLVFTNNILQNGADAVALYAANASDFPNDTSPTTLNLRDAIVYDTDDADDAGLLSVLTPGQPQVNENQNGTANTVSLSRVPDGGTPLATTTYVPRTPTPGTFNQAQSPGIIVLQSDSRIDVEEGGITDSYQIALQTVPTSNVLVTVDPDSQTDLGAGAGVALVLTFTPANALIPQAVTVTAVNDLAIEGAHTSTITHAVSSADSNYNNFPVGNVVANIVDNDFPAPTSIVISEIMYNPASDETSPGVAEWVEIVNAGTTAVDISGWKLEDEDATPWGAIPASTVLNAGQIVVLFDSTFTTAATFRAEWGVPTGALVIGVTWASLANSPSATNEILELWDNVGSQKDIVNFDDASPWPSGANGPSIYLKSSSLDNNSGANWARSIVNQASAVSPAGPTFSTSDVGSPGRFFLPGDYNTSGVVDTADYILWRQLLGTSDPRADGSGSTTGVPDGVVDQFDYTFWRSNFGNVGVPPSGSGTGAGEAASSLVSEPVTVQVTSAESSASRNVLAMDAALIDLMFPSAASPRRVSEVDSISDEPQATTSANLLLVLKAVNEAAGADVSDFSRAEERDGDRSAAVDESYQLLDVEDFFDGVGLMPL
jgi:endonuclease/exonuclease/phosphatase family metal-dependent hydrolase